MLSDVINELPEYYPSMHLDGYSPEEILMSKHKQMIEEASSEILIEIDISKRGECKWDIKK